MAAVIIALLRWRQGVEELPPDAEDGCLPSPKSHDVTLDEVDTNKDGRVSVAEMLAVMPSIAIRIDVFRERLQLERELLASMRKLPTFCICVIGFLIAMTQLQPSGQISAVQEHLVTHYELDTLKNVLDIPTIYAFTQRFEQHNAELMATSSKYWCEDRYRTVKWNDEYHVPIRRCPSPRLYSLHHINDENAKWSVLNPGGHLGTHHHSTTSSNMNSTSTASRHNLGMETNSQLTPAHKGNTSCQDDDAGLAYEEEKPGATCAADAAHVCNIDLGIRFCPVTCGYCPEFSYHHLRNFNQPQVTMLPTVLYQTRFAMAPCHGFAHTYEHQPYNPKLNLLPALDGKRHGRVLTCIDRERKHEEPYALVAECPPNMSHCHDGVMDVTPKHTFLREAIYPAILIEPAVDLGAMKEVEWLDMQTDTLTVSTMVYTEGVELFTSLSVDFTFDQAGNVRHHLKMLTYCDLVKGSKVTFIVSLIICCVCALQAVIMSTRHMLKHPEDCKWGYVLYELLSRSVLFVYPTVLLISWSQQIPMAREYDMLLHTFLDTTGMTAQHTDDMIANYLKVKEHIYGETSWLKRHRVSCFIVCYMQFVQLIFYCSAHPKLGVLTATIFKALESLTNFMVLFSLVFVFMAFLAHWMLGGSLKEFATFGDALSAQGRMVYGEFIFADGADELHGVMMFMYWVYALTFMIVAFFTLMNFFLAIVVEAFTDVKTENNKRLAVGPFFEDVFRTTYSSCMSQRYGWPSFKQLMMFLEEKEKQFYEVNRTVSWVDNLECQIEEEDADDIPFPAILPDTLQREFPQNFRYRKHVAVLLTHYFSHSTSILCRRNQRQKKPIKQITNLDLPGAFKKEPSYEEGSKCTSNPQRSERPPSAHSSPPSAHERPPAAQDMLPSACERPSSANRSKIEESASAGAATRQHINPKTARVGGFAQDCSNNCGLQVPSEALS